MKYGDSGHRYTASQRRRYLAPSFSSFRRFRSPSPLLLPSRPPLPSLLFRIPFLVSSYIRTRSAGVERAAGHPPYAAVFHIIYNPRPARRPRNNSVRIRERASVSPNWWKTVRGRRNLSRPVTTLSDVVARGSDVRGCVRWRTKENMIAQQFLRVDFDGFVTTRGRCNRLSMKDAAKVFFITQLLSKMIFTIKLFTAI